MKDFVIGFSWLGGNFNLALSVQEMGLGLKNMMLAFLPGVGMVALTI